MMMRSASHRPTLWLAVACALCLTCVTAGAAGAPDTQTPQSRETSPDSLNSLQITFRPEKRAYVFGEPVYVLVEVRNAGSTTITYADGNDRRPAGRHDGYHFTARDDTDRQVRDPLKNPPNLQSETFNRSLPPGGALRDRILLNQWCRFEGPGRYRVSGRRLLFPPVPPSESESTAASKKSVPSSAEQPTTRDPLSAQGTFEVVLEADEAKLTEIHGTLLADLDFVTLSWLWHPSLESRYVEWLGGPLFANEAQALLSAAERVDHRTFIRGLLVLIRRGARDEKVLDVAVQRVRDDHLREAIPWLHWVVNHGSIRAQTVAVNALTLFDDRSELTVDDLAPLLRSDDMELRREAVEALGYSSDDPLRAKRILLDRLEHDPDSPVRFMAAAMLAVNHDPTGVKGLVESSDEGLAVYFLERSTGIQLQPRTIDAWKAWLQRTGGRVSAAERLRIYTEGLHSADTMQRLDAARLVGRIGAQGKTAIPLLRQALLDPDEWVRIGAAESLANLGDRPDASVAALAPLLSSATPDVPHQAIAHVANFGQRVEPLLRDLLHSKDARLRSLAADALGQTWARDSRTLDELAGALGDEDIDVRIQAMTALGWKGHRAARHVPAIAAFLDQPSPPLRVYALQSLARIGDRRVIGRIQPLQADEDPVVREAAALALQRLQH